MNKEEKIKALNELFDIITWPNIPPRLMDKAKWLARNGYILGPRAEKESPVGFWTDKAEDFLKKNDIEWSK